MTNQGLYFRLVAVLHLERRSVIGRRVVESQSGTRFRHTTRAKTVSAHWRPIRDQRPIATANQKRARFNTGLSARAPPQSSHGWPIRSANSEPIFESRNRPTPSVFDLGSATANGILGNSSRAAASTDATKANETRIHRDLRGESTSPRVWANRSRWRPASRTVSSNHGPSYWVLVSRLVRDATGASLCCNFGLVSTFRRLRVGFRWNAEDIPFLENLVFVKTNKRRRTLCQVV